MRRLFSKTIVFNEKRIETKRYDYPYNPWVTMQNARSICSVPYSKRLKFKGGTSYEYCIPMKYKEHFGDICGTWYYPYSKFLTVVASKLWSNE